MQMGGNRHSPISRFSHTYYETLLYLQGLELYQLSIGEQTAAMIILMGFVEQGKQVLNLDEKASRLFSRRIIDATRRLIPIIKENEWDKKFDDGVDWKKYM